jgi:FkbM family methyltransferase
MTIRKKAIAIARRIDARFAPKQGYVEPAWREVRHGVLKGAWFLLPEGNGKSWADRIVAGTYECDLLPAFAKLAEEGGVLYDIGAHIGFFTCAWLKLGGTSVEAFEPVPLNRSVLNDILVRNGLKDRVRIHALALGDYNGAGTLLIDSRTLGSTSMAFVEGIGGIDSQKGSAVYVGSTKSDVPVRKLDDVLADMSLAQPAVIKIDVEGAEAHVVAGAVKILTDYKPTLLCEVHNIDSGLMLSQQLERMGYELQLKVHSGAQVECIWAPEKTRIALGATTQGYILP